MLSAQGHDFFILLLYSREADSTNNFFETADSLPMDQSANWVVVQLS